jgi:hypothetical protein
MLEGVYLDNFLIYSSDKMTHHIYCLCKHCLYAKLEKCEFDCESVKYLSYILSPTGLTMAVDKIQVIQDWPELWKVRDVQVC